MQTWIFQGNPDDYDIDGHAKVMNFRSIDPRAAGESMSGAGETESDSLERVLQSNDIVNSVSSASLRVIGGARGELGSALPNAVEISMMVNRRKRVSSND